MSREIDALRKLRKYCEASYRRRNVRREGEETGEKEMSDQIQEALEWFKSRCAGDPSTYGDRIAGQNLAAAYRSLRAELEASEAKRKEAERRCEFKELTGTEIPADELAEALKFADFDGKEQMMCGWQSVHRELHVIYSAYMGLKAEKEAAKAECKTWEETVAIWKDSAKILEAKLSEAQSGLDVLRLAAMNLYVALNAGIATDDHLKRLGDALKSMTAFDRAGEDKP